MNAILGSLFSNFSETLLSFFSQLFEQLFGGILG